MAGVSDSAEKSLSARLNEFGLEDGTASAWYADDDDEDSDAYHIGLQTWTGKYDRVKDFTDGTTITTKTQRVSFNHYSQICLTHQDAENAAQGIADLSDYSISPITLKSGSKKWRMSGKGAPTAYGAWT